MTLRPHFELFQKPPFYKSPCWLIALQFVGCPFTPISISPPLCWCLFSFIEQRINSIKSHNSSSHGICEVNAWSLWGGLSSGYCPCSSACIQPWKKTWTCENWNRCEKVQGYDHYDDFVALERDYKRNRQETGDGENIVEPCDACKQIKDPQLARMLISDEAL